jgi:RNA polymerase sigma factor (sigma-70 family)
MRKDPDHDKELQRKYRFLVFYFGRRLPSHLSHRAEDLAQDTLWAWLKKSGEPDRVRDPERYLVRIAHNVLCDELNGDHFGPTVTLDPEAAELVHRLNAEHQLLEKERYQGLLKALRHLSQADMELLRLLRLQGIHNGEVARRLGLSPADCSRKLWEIRQKLMNLMKRQ